MRIRIWNAYASNNSGSYTIVGRLPSAEIAERTASELREMIEAHTAWHEAWDGKTGLEDSPLARFCRDQGLPWSEGDGGRDDWPEHSEDNRPRVVVSGAQIIVHHDYTVDLPPSFGALFYKRGGRVEHEEAHAHHPIVVTARFSWGWSSERRAVQKTELPRLIADLTGPDGPLMTLNVHDVPSAWRAKDDEVAEAPLTVGVAFADLIEGVAALRARADAHGAYLELRLAEAPSEDDPLVHLRPSFPGVPRFDVLVTELGENRKALENAALVVRGQYELGLGDLFRQAPPVLVARSFLEEHARAIANALSAAGAKTELRRNDG